MKKIPVYNRTKIIDYSLVDDEDFDYLNQWKWGMSKGYAVRTETKSIHRVIAKTPVGMYTDHKNGNRLDNRKENLRVCTMTENNHNSKIAKDNTSGYRGVCWHKRQNKWRASIMINKKNKHIGTFDDIVEAAKAYDRYAKKLHGKFASLNFDPVQILIQTGKCKPVK